MHSIWTVSPATSSALNQVTGFITLSPYICTWKIQTEIIEVLSALDASNLILVYESEKPVPCLGACPSGSTNSEDPLEIHGYITGSNPPRYNVSVLYYGNDVLTIDSASPMPGERAISAMIAVLVNELETIMDKGERPKLPKPMKKIKHKKHKTKKGTTIRKTKKGSATLVASSLFVLCTS